jgi:cytidylate kinase
MKAGRAPKGIVAISGKSGCGNTTVSRLLAERLGVQLINYTFRAMAVEKGISFEKILELAENDFSYDRELDARQIELARKGDCVIGSRLAIWLLPDAALRVYLRAGPQVRANRIWTREGGDPARVLAATLERDVQDRERYRQIYGIDNDDSSVADLIINTELFMPAQIAELIALALQKAQPKA